MFAAFRQSPLGLRIFSLLMLAGAIVAIWQIVRTADGGSTAPAYRNAPPTAFAPAVADSLVDPEALKASRLPDEVWERLHRDCRALATSGATGTLTARNLQRAGIGRDRADAVLAEIEGVQSSVFGRPVSVAKTFALAQGQRDSALLVGTLRFGATRDGDPPLEGSAKCSYTRDQQRGEWKLTQFAVSL